MGGVGRIVVFPPTTMTTILPASSMHRKLAFERTGPQRVLSYVFG